MLQYTVHFHKSWWRSGNAAVCKTAMRGFDSRPGLTYIACDVVCPGGEIGRHEGLKIPCLSNGVRVQFPPWAHTSKWKHFFFKEVFSFRKQTSLLSDLRVKRSHNFIPFTREKIDELGQQVLSARSQWNWWEHLVTCVHQSFNSRPRLISWNISTFIVNSCARFKHIRL